MNSFSTGGGNFHHQTMTTSRRSSSIRFSLLLVLCCCILFIGSCLAADLYETLHVPKNAAQDQIKRAFKKLTMKYHPDRYKGDDKADAQKKYAQISHAYEVLSDEKKRQVYDRYGEEGLKQQERGGHPGGGMGGMDIFSEFFGGGGGFHFNFGGGNDGQEEEDEFKGQDLRIPLEVTLENLYNGRLMNFKRVRTAHEGNSQPKKCECRNKVIRMMVINGVMKRMTENNCEECKNRFDVVQKATALTIQIDRGMRDGEEIIFYGEGDATRSHRSGDLIFIVKTKEHSTFTRVGDDLKMKMDISLKESLTGLTKIIKHLDDRNLQIKIDNVIKPNSIRVVKGEGMPRKENPAQRGDLHIEFNVIFPTSLTTAQQDELKKIL
ncbi:DnaJ heat shock family protein [Naegleria gruberi]|uniref:DnaJ heat shock family protein n=1 Tax=Naegleria gruberi TaxID=5762 RepID=D2W2V7_NAEGR|nr:DnaJ heat shock family protein [Naegleria gruberi]EFC36616.1 DnaJ heat shock family protein [Naegleria gruberi]|eukprot:XP_002669360.1 DnaJ heat shock family protein [Naegleria gruberi strain NEG-M]